MPDSERKYNTPLRHGRNQFKAIKMLAAGATQQEVADHFEIGQPAVSDFAARHRHEIAAARAAPDDELSGLWIANRADRIGEYQQQYAMVTEQAHRVARAAEALSEIGGGEDAGVVLDSEDLVRLIAQQQKLLRGVAEELGQMPARAHLTFDAPVLRVHIEGVDMDDV